MLSKHIVNFYDDEIEISRFLDDLAKYEMMGDPFEYEKKCGCPVTEEAKEERFRHYIIWWFLSRNTTVMYEEDKRRYLQIRFGRGRSGHTWRDFRQTIKLINLYMKKEKKHTFIVSDEMDDFEVPRSVIVTFKPYKTIDEQPDPFVT
jgi:hypothetical protein